MKQFFKTLNSRNLSFFLFVLFAFLGLQLHTQSFRKGPYLIFPGAPAQMTILWQTYQTETCRIDWGTTNKYLDGSDIPTESGSGGDEHQYVYTLNNLTPDTKYFYRLICGSDTSRSFFHSSVPETAKHLKFLAFGDTRSHPEDMNTVTHRMLLEIENDSSFQSFLIHSGDFNSNDLESSWDNQFFNRSYPSNLEVQARLPIVGVRGNHEGSATRYNKYWPYPYLNSGDYYSFDYGPVHIAVVDEYTDFSTGSQQLEWLQNDLALSNKLWKFICLHEPGYTDESYHHDNADVQNYIQPLCVQYDVKVVFGGHNHYYAHCLKDSVHHLTLGGGGAPLYPANHIGEGLIMSERTFHFAEVSIDNDSLFIRIIRPDGSVVESLSLVNVVDDINPLQEENGIKILVREKVLFVSGLASASMMSITDISGKTVYYEKIQAGSSQINVNTFPPGIYLVSISGKQTTSQKVRVY